MSVSAPPVAAVTLHACLEDGWTLLMPSLPLETPSWRSVGCSPWELGDALSEEVSLTIATLLLHLLRQRFSRKDTPDDVMV